MNDKGKEIVLFCFILGAIWAFIPLLCGHLGGAMMLFMTGSIAGIIPAIIAVVIVDKIMISKKKRGEISIKNRTIRKIPKQSNRGL